MGGVVFNQEVPFVRIRQYDELSKMLNLKHSIKIVGIPGIGVSTFLKKLWRKTSSGGDLSDDFFSVYLSSSYEFERVKESVVRQMEAGGFEQKIESKDISKLLLEILNYVKSRKKGVRLLIIFDDFSSNFASQKRNSILTRDFLCGMKQLVEEQSEIQFVVAYQFPIDALLGDDWYLNNFESIYLDLLSNSEIRMLIESRIDDKEIEREVLLCGGCHPQFLDTACVYYLSNNAKDFARWANHRHREIFVHLSNTVDEKQVISTFASIARKGEAYGRERELDTDIFGKYCCTKEQIEYIGSPLFSEDFHNQILMYQEKKTDISKNCRYFTLERIANIDSRWIKMIALIAIDLAIIPFLIALSCIILTMLTEHIYYVYEFDSFGYNPDFLRQSWLRLGLRSFLITFISGYIVHLLNLVFRKHRLVRLSMPRFNDAENTFERMEHIFLSLPYHVSIFALIVLTSSIFLSWENNTKYDKDILEKATWNFVSEYESLKRLEGDDGCRRHVRGMLWSMLGIHERGGSNEYLLAACCTMSVRGHFASAIKKYSGTIQRSIELNDTILEARSSFLQIANDDAKSLNQFKLALPFMKIGNEILVGDVNSKEIDSVFRELSTLGFDTGQSEMEFIKKLSKDESILARYKASVIYLVVKSGFSNMKETGDIDLLLDGISELKYFQNSYEGRD